MPTHQPKNRWRAFLQGMAEPDAMSQREKLDQWRQCTGRNPMRRFSYVAEYFPTDLSIKLTTPVMVNSSRSTVKRKPLCCINHCPNLITEQTQNQLNIKLCFDDDFVSAATETDEQEDNEITINPARRKSQRSLIVETDVMFTSTTIRYTTSIPKHRSMGGEGFCITPVKRSTRRRKMSTPGYLSDQKSCYNSPSEIDTSETVVIIPNKYLNSIDKI